MTGVDEGGKLGRVQMEGMKEGRKKAWLVGVEDRTGEPIAAGLVPESIPQY